MLSVAFTTNRERQIGGRIPTAGINSKQIYYYCHVLLFAMLAFYKWRKSNILAYDEPSQFLLVTI